MKFVITVLTLNSVTQSHLVDAASFVEALNQINTGDALEVRIVEVLYDYTAQKEKPATPEFKDLVNELKNSPFFQDVNKSIKTVRDNIEGLAQHVVKTWEEMNKKPPVES